MIKLVKLIFTATLITLVTCQGNDKHMVCRQVDDICSPHSAATGASLTPPMQKPGKRGPKGDMGLRGGRGPQGPPAKVDYEHINREIDLKIAREFEKLTQKIEQLRLDVPTTTTMASTTSGPCGGFIFEDKCFKAVYTNTQTMQYAAAKTSCENAGMKLANIYSLQHFALMKKYLLQLKTSNSYIGLYLGMTRDQNTKTLLLSDGRTAAKNIPWYPRYPVEGADKTKMLVLFHKDANSRNQGIYNYLDSIVRHGGMCEDE